MCIIWDSIRIQLRSYAETTSHIRRTTQTEDVCEQGGEENIWT